MELARLLVKEGMWSCVFADVSGDVSGCSGALRALQEDSRVGMPLNKQ